MSTQEIGKPHSVSLGTYFTSLPRGEWLARYPQWRNTRYINSEDLGETNHRNAGKISADRSTKTTLTLTIPGCD